MKKGMFFVIVFLAIFVVPIVAQPVFVVSSIDSDYVKEGDIIVYGELKNAKDCGVIFYDDVAINYNQLHILYKRKIISIFPDNILSIIDFFYDCDDRHSFKQQNRSPIDINNPIEAFTNPDNVIDSPTITFDYISDGIVYFADKKTGKGKQGVIIDGSIVIEYFHKTKTMTLYFSKLKIDW